jgi:vacuolar-type H+-ATPase subunit I/STV1
VLDLYFIENKTYHEIAKIARISPRDMKPIIDKASQEKERQAHKSLAVQAYELFSKGKTLIQVTIDLNLGQAQATAYYGEYLKLVGLGDITKIYVEFKGNVSYFVSLCKAAKAAKMSVPQVINLLMIANNYLPSVQRRHEQLQNENIILDSDLRSAAREFQNLSNQITYMNKRLDDIKSESSTENATLEYIRQEIAKLEAFVYNFRNNDDGYTKLIKTIEEEVLRILSNKKALLKLAVLSIAESIRNNPDRYSPLISNHNDNSYSSLATVVTDTEQIRQIRTDCVNIFARPA